jgi:hypothetical protein
MPNNPFESPLRMAGRDGATAYEQNIREMQAAAAASQRSSSVPAGNPRTLSQDPNVGKAIPVLKFDPLGDSK